jgi:membrane protein implicated in regulation of membrane protease activity
MLIFVSIAIAAFIIMAGSFIFGHDMDHDASHDMGHDAGGEGTISIFSTKVIATMLMGFGAAGAIARYYGCGYPASSIIGVVFGLILAGAMFALLELIAKQQSSSVSRSEDVVGSTGIVTVSIGADDPGEVGVTCGGRYMNYSARSAARKAIGKGRQVKIVAAQGGSVSVEEIGNQ